MEDQSELWKACGKFQILVNLHEINTFSSMNVGLTDLDLVNLT